MHKPQATYAQINIVDFDLRWSKYRFQYAVVLGMQDESIKSNVESKQNMLDDMGLEDLPEVHSLGISMHV